MATTVASFINSLDLRFANQYAGATKVEWVNDVEQAVYDEIFEDYRAVYVPLTANRYAYPLPSGIDFSQLYSIFVNDRQYKKCSLRHNKERHSYWVDNGEINIYPAPHLSDVSYTSNSNELTFEDNKITTSGDSFANFTADKMLLVSGCTSEPDNNKYAVLVSRTETELIFADGTFTPQAEAGEVTISQPSMRIVYRYLPPLKEYANIATETLLLPARFHNLYYYYCCMQMSILTREFNGEAQNFAALYNNAWKELVAWYNERRPMKADSQIEAGY